MLKLDFINVGYGDSILVRLMKTDRTVFSILVDCGDLTLGKTEEGSKRIRAVELLKKEGVSRLDVLALSHLHLDHTGGLPDLADEIEIKELWVNYLPPQQYWGKVVGCGEKLSPGGNCLLTSLNLYLQALDTLREKGTRIVLHRNNKQRIDLEGDLRVDLFMEEELLEVQDAIWADTLEERGSNTMLTRLDRFINNTSLRIRLQYADRTISLPGDIYAAKWEQKQLPSMDIVKIPHHGHKDSMTQKLSDMLRPEYAVISVSNSRSDCPDPGVIRLLQRHAKEVLFTDAVKAEACKQAFHETVSFCIGSDGSITIDTKEEYSSDRRQSNEG